MRMTVAPEAARYVDRLAFRAVLCGRAVGEVLLSSDGALEYSHRSFKTAHILSIQVVEY